MVTTFYPPYHFGGDAVFAFRLSNALAEQGHEVHVIHCADSWQALAGDIPIRALPHHSGVRIHTLRSRFGSLSPLLTQQTGRMMLKRRSIRRLLEVPTFDVIHYHNISLVGGLEVLEAGDAVKLYTLHDYWLVCPTHIMFKNLQRACESPQCLRCQFIHRRPPQWWRNRSWMRSKLAHVDRFLVASEFAAALHYERGFGREFNIEILPLFCELPEGQSTAGSQPEISETREPYFLFVGRLAKLKGLQDVIPLFRERPNLNLLVAGEGEYEPELRRLATGCSNIRFLGTRDFGALADLYRNALATLIPSLCYEIHPSVMVESWSCGTPVLVRGIGSMREAVQNSGGGLYFESTQELAGQIDVLAADESMRSGLGDQGYRAFATEHTQEVFLRNYFRIIEEARNEHRRRAVAPAT